jgi:hypothetical protein
MIEDMIKSYWVDMIDGLLYISYMFCISHYLDTSIA